MRDWLQRHAHFATWFSAAVALAWVVLWVMAR